MIYGIRKDHAASFGRRLFLTFFMITVAGTCLAQSDIETPYTGKVSCQRILRLKPEGVARVYESEFHAEMKWALADYSRCFYNANDANGKRLAPPAQTSLSRLRDITETYFNSIYTMRANEVGGGEPFELDSISAQIGVENLIGRAIKIYSGRVAPRKMSRGLRARAARHLARIEGRLPEMTAPLRASDVAWLDTSTESGRESFRRLQQDHQEAAADMRRSVKELRALVPTLPGTLALLAAELVDRDY